MKALSRTLQALAVIGALISAGLYFASDQLNGVNRAQLEEADSKVKFEQSRANRFASDLEALREEQSSLQEQRDNAVAQRAAAEAKLTQLQRENDRFQQLKQSLENAQQRLQTENARLGRELAELQAASVDKGLVAEYETEIARLERQLLDLQETQAASNQRQSAADQTSPTPSSAPSLAGTVLTVGKGASFVVLDIGYNDGVRLQSELVISHATTPIAKIQVTEVKENLSIARVLPDSITKTPKPGDSVSSVN